MDKINILFDCCSFDFFLKNSIDPVNDLPQEKYNLCITPEVRDEIFKPNTPPEKTQRVEKWLEEESLHIHTTFSLCTYSDSEEDMKNKGGFTTYEDYDNQHGSCLTYEKILYYKNGRKDREGTAYLTHPENMTDVILTTHSIQSIVLTTDNGKELKNAREQGYNIVLLKQDEFNGLNLEEYINKKLIEQRKLKKL